MSRDDAAEATAADPVHAHTWNPQAQGFFWLAAAATAGASTVPTRPPAATAGAMAVVLNARTQVYEEQEGLPPTSNGRQAGEVALSPH
jgi:hypothetical protein